MPPGVLLVLAWAGLWAATRAVLGTILCPVISRCLPDTEIELEWWRVTVRHCSPGGLASRLASRHKRALRRWFSVGAVVGVLAGACSVALLATEFWRLLCALAITTPTTAAAAAEAAPTPRLQLALPGLTLPASHSLPLWLALAASLAVHEAGHALAAAAEGAHVSSAGCSLVLLMPAAFVEIDTADLAVLSRYGMLRVATAGAWHNAVLAALAAVPLLLAGGSSSSAVFLAAAWAPAQLLLAYTASVSACLALLNMAPVHFLDGQQALEALLLRPKKARELLEDQQAAAAAAAAGTEGEEEEEEAGKGHGAKAAAAAAASGRYGGGGSVLSGADEYVKLLLRLLLASGTTLYAGVVTLHLLRMR